MAVKRISLEEFLTLANTHPVLDVRSPGEYLHAHIPGAISLPLFSDEERKVVGTAYKQQSKQVAVKIGSKYFGVKMVEMVETVEALFRGLQENSTPETPFTPRTVLVHCWRGGMRSAGVAWLLDLYGYQVYTLQGGYKAYRGWVLAQFEKEYPIQILGGYTGSGKTEVLKVMAQQSASVIDLEGLAGHKGSAFGNMGLPPQPSQEHFENKLANALFFAAQETNSPQPIWMEDESQRIGTVNIPTVLYQQMRKKPVYFLEIPFDARLDYICLHYGKFPKEQLVNAVIRIKKRLGGLETKTAINALVEDDVRGSFSVLLQYYDKQYGKGLERNRENPSSLVTRIEATIVDDQANAALVQAKQ